MSLTTLNQALIHTPTPNLMGVIQSELMISQAFQACYSIEDCPSNRCVLSQERVEYKIGNIYQLNVKYGAEQEQSGPEWSGNTPE